MCWGVRSSSLCYLPENLDRKKWIERNGDVEVAVPQIQAIMSMRTTKVGKSLRINYNLGKFYVITSSL